MSNWVNDTAEIVKGFGFRVFIRPTAKTYLWYTDGDRFGYIQDERGYYHVTTEWIGSRAHGTGGMHGDFPVLTEEILKDGLIGPHWARNNRGDAYKNLDQFLKAHSWDGGIIEV
jgi:hypothetical protein